MNCNYFNIYFAGFVVVNFNLFFSACRFKLSNKLDNDSHTVSKFGPIVQQPKHIVYKHVVLTEVNIILKALHCISRLHTVSARVTTVELPFVATSATGTLRVFAIEPMNENITTPPKTLVRESPNVTTAASLYSREQLIVIYLFVT